MTFEEQNKFNEKLFKILASIYTEDCGVPFRSYCNRRDYVLEELGKYYDEVQSKPSDIESNLFIIDEMFDDRKRAKIGNVSLINLLYIYRVIMQTESGHVSPAQDSYIKFRDDVCRCLIEKLNHELSRLSDRTKDETYKDEIIISMGKLDLRSSPLRELFYVQIRGEDKIMLSLSSFFDYVNSRYNQLEKLGGHVKQTNRFLSFCKKILQVLGLRKETYEESCRRQVDFTGKPLVNHGALFFKPLSQNVAPFGDLEPSKASDNKSICYT